MNAVTLPNVQHVEIQFDKSRQKRSAEELLHLGYFDFWIPGHVGGEFEGDHVTSVIAHYDDGIDRVKFDDGGKRAAIMLKNEGYRQASIINRDS
ncbi:hypothetical protein INR49_012550 [Caranx melampygus]|nr:hypothetical protein INR49_012550 [Caranx melampygus]